MRSPVFMLLVMTLVLLVLVAWTAVPDCYVAGACG